MALFSCCKLRLLSTISRRELLQCIRSVGSESVESPVLIEHPHTKKVDTLPKARYGGRHAVTMLPGGGIGPELMSYVKEVFKYGGVPVDFEIVQIHPTSDSNEDLEYAITSIRRNGVAIKGNIETKSLDTGVISRNVAIRNELDLYVNVIHCKSYAGVSGRQKDIDIVIVRQNTEGEYAMLEHESTPGIVESMKVITAQNSERVARYAFEYARKNGRKKVTTVHKANIMKLSDGLFLETSRKVAKEYPEIQHSDMIIDNCCMQLVSNPHQFEVMNMANLYGSIVSNVICGLIGGAGLLSGRNFGDYYAVFEPGTRNTGTAIAGKNIANPVAMLNASVDMLYYLGLQPYADTLKTAIDKTLNEDKIHTPDLKGEATSLDVVQNIIKHVKTLSANCIRPDLGINMCCPSAQHSFPEHILEKRPLGLDNHNLESRRSNYSVELFNRHWKANVH